MYEGGLAGVRLVPVQGLTAAVLTITALVATWLFFQERCRAAFLLCLLASQGWRVLSERLRADFRGYSMVSAYQKMGLAAVAYALALAWLLPAGPTNTVQLDRGLALLAEPVVLIGLQLLWWLLFLRFGRSTVTEATLDFAVRRDRI